MAARAGRSRLWPPRGARSSRSRCTRARRWRSASALARRGRPRTLRALAGRRRRSRATALERPIEARLGGAGALAARPAAGAAALALADRRAGGAARPARTRAPLRRPVARARAGGGARPGRLAHRRDARRGAGARLRARRTPRGSRSASPGPCSRGATRAEGVAAAARAGRSARGAGAAPRRAPATRRAAHVGLERRRPLWPYAAERALLAGAILAVRYRRAR